MFMRSAAVLAFIGAFVASLVRAENITVEAENATLVAPMSIGLDPAASGGQFVFSPLLDSGTATFNVTTTVGGTYVIWCRVLCPTSNSDSFFVSVDGGPERIYDAAENTWGPNWQWTVVNARNASGTLTLFENPRQFNLPPGAHAISFRGREVNTPLDEITVTNDMAFAPNSPPRVDAGPDHVITLAAGSALLSGTAVDDGRPAPPALTYQWSVAGAPAGGLLSFTNGTLPGATGVVSGTIGRYMARLTVNDSALTASDDTAIYVNNGNVFAASFAGGTNTIDAGTYASIGNIFATGGAVSFWVRADTLWDGVFMEKGPWDIWADSVGRVFFDHNAAVTGSVWETPQGVFEVGRWTNIVIVFDKSVSTNQPQVYLNGVSQHMTQSTVNSGAFTSDAASRLVIGRRWADYLIGAIDEVQLYTRALSITDVSDIYAGGVGHYGPVGANCVANWHLDEGSGSSAADATGNGNTATLQAGTTWALGIIDPAASAAASRPPVVEAGPAQVITLPSPAVLSGTVSAPQAVTTTWALISFPVGGSVTFGNSAKLLTTAAFNISGTYTLRLTATDGVNSASDTLQVSALPATANNLPVLAAVSGTTVLAGATLAFTLSATDADGDSIVYSAIGLPAGATLNPASGAFSWSPTAGQVGSYDVAFIASDGRGGTAARIVAYVVSTNQAPVISAIGDKTVAETQLLAFTVSAIDADADPLTWSAAGLPTGAVFNTSSGAFTWTPTAGQSGTYAVTFNVSDGRGGTDSETITITVTAFVNFPPVLDDIMDMSGTVGLTLTFTLHATDPNSDPITYSGSSLPAGATLNPSTGVFSWTPAAVSVSTVTFRASDGRGGVSSQSIHIIVFGAAGNHAPVLAAVGNKTVAEAAALAFTLSATDADGNTITYSATNLPSGAVLNSATGAFSWTPGTGTAAVYFVTFTADDSVGGTDSETIDITVTAAGSVPGGGTGGGGGGCDLGSDTTGLSLLLLGLLSAISLMRRRPRPKCETICRSCGGRIDG
jgi:hypothetical protein